MKAGGKRGMARMVAAWHNSRAGLRDIWQSEEAFRVEVAVLAASVPAALWLGTGVAQTGLLIGSIVVLLVVEILNSAIEAVVDRIGPERHELSRKAKDLGSAAVLIATLFPVVVWGCVILSRLGWITL